MYQRQRSRGSLQPKPYLSRRRCHPSATRRWCKCCLGWSWHATPPSRVSLLPSLKVTCRKSCSAPWRHPPIHPPLQTKERAGKRHVPAHSGTQYALRADAGHTHTNAVTAPLFRFVCHVPARGDKRRTSGYQVVHHRTDTLI